MSARVSKILDECIARIEKGETIETCLAECPDVRKQLEPLLYMALAISAIPKISPSDDFRRMAKARLITRLRQQSVPAKTLDPELPIVQRNELARLWGALRQTIAGARKPAICITAALLLALGGSILLPAILNLVSPHPAMASPCTLSILSGKVEFGKAGWDSWQPSTDGMALTIGTDVRTAADGHAVLTFFEGSTTKLEPGCVVGIRQMEGSDGESARIVVEQLLGRTWSSVERMAPGSYYKIETPSATVMALGTLFTTDVDETGVTKVAATQGLVSVIAQGEEVRLRASYQTEVEAGSAPSIPTRASLPKTELLVTTDLPAVCSIRDPTGSSTGYLPSGVSFNQITASQSSLLSSGRQVTSIVQPVSGEYVLTLRYTAQETARFNVQSRSEGKVVFEHTEELSSVNGAGWLVRINLNVDGDVLVSSRIVAIEPLGDIGPEKVVTTDLARERAVPIEATARDNDAQDADTGSEGDDGGVGDNTENGDTYHDIGAENKKDTITHRDTGDDVCYDNDGGHKSDAATSDNVGIEGAKS
jgi:hypothetical protein